MKVLCIDNKKYEHSITINKYYDEFKPPIPSLHEDTYLIIDDNGDKHYVSKYRFKTIDKVREEKLNKLGI